MAASPDYLRAQYAVLEKQTKLLLNADLKEICRREGLPISGIKAALQNRVLTRKHEGGGIWVTKAYQEFHQNSET